MKSETNENQNLKTAMNKNEKMSKRMRAVDNLESESDIKKVAEMAYDPSLICKALLNKNLTDNCFVARFKGEKNKEIQEVLNSRMDKKIRKRVVVEEFNERIKEVAEVKLRQLRKL